MSSNQRRRERRAERAEEDRIREAELELRLRDKRDEIGDIFREISDYNDDTGARQLDFDRLAAILHKLGYRAWTA